MSEETLAKPEQESQPEQAVQPNVTVQDLFAATQIIDAATRRGTFSASEVAVVGNVYNRITEFLKISAPELFQAGNQGAANE
jgi:hypothetical protein